MSIPIQERIVVNFSAHPDQAGLKSKKAVINDDDGFFIGSFPMPIVTNQQ
jgi:hypothetical protein